MYASIRDCSWSPPLTLAIVVTMLFRRMFVKLTSVKKACGGDVAGTPREVVVVFCEFIDFCCCCCFRRFSSSITRLCVWRALENRGWYYHKLAIQIFKKTFSTRSLLQSVLFRH
jgi:hypothetical protein